MESNNDHTPVKPYTADENGMYIFDPPIRVFSWHISIIDCFGVVRDIPLDHRYATEEEARREAEDIADQVYTAWDMGWSLHADALGYTDTRRNINIALEIIMEKGIPL